MHFSGKPHFIERNVLRLEMKGKMEIPIHPAARDIRRGHSSGYGSPGGNRLLERLVSEL